MSDKAEFRHMLENDEFFRSNPKLKKALEALDDEEGKQRRLERRLKAEMHLENARRLLDSLRR